jgi:hypothetical protein
MTDVHYTQHRNKNNNYTVRVGKHNIGKSRNVQYFSEVEVGYIKNSVVPIDDGPSEWVNARELIGVTGFNAIKNNEDYLKELLPYNYRGFLKDWEIIVLFVREDRSGMRKACLRNNDTNEICLVTSWDQVFGNKSIVCTKYGWWACNTHMHAPATFYVAVKSAL